MSQAIICGWRRLTVLQPHPTLSRLVGAQYEGCGEHPSRFLHRHEHRCCRPCLCTRRIRTWTPWGYKQSEDSLATRQRPEILPALVRTFVKQRISETAEERYVVSCQLLGGKWLKSIAHKNCTSRRLSATWRRWLQIHGPMYRILAWHQRSMDSTFSAKAIVLVDQGDKLHEGATLESE